jgi:hypothetical protein
MIYKSTRSPHGQPVRNQPLAWCDRIGIVAVLLAAAVIAIATADGHYDELRNPAIFWGVIKAALYVGGAFWLLLRALDFILGGPTTRAHAARWR